MLSHTLSNCPWLVEKAANQFHMSMPMQSIEKPAGRCEFYDTPLPRWDRQTGLRAPLASLTCCGNGRHEQRTNMRMCIRLQSPEAGRAGKSHQPVPTSSIMLF